MCLYCTVRKRLYRGLHLRGRKQARTGGVVITGTAGSKCTEGGTNRGKTIKSVKWVVLAEKCIDLGSCYRAG